MVSVIPMGTSRRGRYGGGYAKGPPKVEGLLASVLKGETVEPVTRNSDAWKRPGRPQQGEGDTEVSQAS